MVAKGGLRAHESTCYGCSWLRLLVNAKRQWRDTEIHR